MQLPYSWTQRSDLSLHLMKNMTRFTTDHIQYIGNKDGLVVAKVTFLVCRRGGKRANGGLGRR